MDLEGTRRVRLAARASITKQAMGRQVADLAERGLVSLEPEPSEDAPEPLDTHPTR